MSETRDTCPEEVTVETNFTRREEIPVRTRKECHPKQRKLHVQKAEMSSMMLSGNSRQLEVTRMQAWEVKQQQITQGAFTASLLKNLNFLLWVIRSY